MKNRECIETFAQKNSGYLTGSNIAVRDRYLFSYNTIIGAIINSKYAIVNTKYYSTTTSTHRNFFIQSCIRNNKKIIYCNIEDNHTFINIIKRIESLITSFKRLNYELGDYI